VLRKDDRTGLKKVFDVYGLRENLPTWRSVRRDRDALSSAPTPPDLTETDIRFGEKLRWPSEEGRDWKIEQLFCREGLDS
jgi:hypothetical protein